MLIVPDQVLFFSGCPYFLYLTRFTFTSCHFRNSYPKNGTGFSRGVTNVFSSLSSSANSFSRIFPASTIIFIACSLFPEIGRASCRGRRAIGVHVDRLRE